MLLKAITKTFPDFNACCFGRKGAVLFVQDNQTASEVSCNVICDLGGII